ncbi:hypothetical protein F5Y10DRAFT_217019 [Nemania abortiva]|nr:hypothetical protein F5Y10DRAFT_217019 [Nemania abortiva]
MRRTIPRLAHLRPLSAHVKPRPVPSGASKPVSWDGSTGEVEPGKHVISTCREHDISFPQQARSVKVGLGANPYRLSVAISQKHCVSVHSMQYFDKFEHPLTKTILDHYIEKKKEPLWVSCFAYGASPFPCRKAAKKVAHALRDALAAAGYDRFGRRMLVGHGPSTVLDLYGTLRVISHDPCAVCNAKFIDLLEHAKKIISCVEITLRRGKNGRHLEGQKPKQHPPRTHGAWQNQRHEPDSRQRQHTGRSSAPPQWNRPR